MDEEQPVLSKPEIDYILLMFVALAIAVVIAFWMFFSQREKVEPAKPEQVKVEGGIRT